MVSIEFRTDYIPSAIYPSFSKKKSRKKIENTLYTFTYYIQNQKRDQTCKTRVVKHKLSNINYFLTQLIINIKKRTYYTLTNRNRLFGRCLNKTGMPF